MVDSQFTRRVVPKVTVKGSLGSGCSRCCSSSRASAGLWRLARWTRLLTVSQNSRQAASSWPIVLYWGSRFAEVGTRSAFAMRTVASLPPFVSGSAGRQVRIVMPYSLNSWLST